MRPNSDKVASTIFPVDNLAVLTTDVITKNVKTKIFYSNQSCFQVIVFKLLFDLFGMTVINVFPVLTAVSVVFAAFTKSDADFMSSTKLYRFSAREAPLIALKIRNFVLFFYEINYFHRKRRSENAQKLLRIWQQ
jgi:hypothetical protein